MDGNFYLMAKQPTVKNFKQQYVNEGWIVENGNLLALGKGGDLGGDIITVSNLKK